MLYPVTTNIYIQTDQISFMTISTLTITMADATTYVVSAAKFNDIVSIVNDAFNS